ncbi:hypothetical protein S83_035646, partial [Arachis hypogaea]
MSKLGGGNCFRRLLLSVNVGLALVEEIVAFVALFQGSNILVDNKGCIKLADFGASKQVIELAIILGAKSMKGTPYWMAPEVAALFHIGTTKSHPSIPDHLSIAAKDFLLKWFIELDLEKRYTLRAAIVTCGGLCPGLNDVIRQ